MRIRVLAGLGALLLAVSAQATPIITINGGTAPAQLVPGQVATITIGITPDANLVSGFNLIFQVTDPALISLVSCSPAAGVQMSCPAGGLNFSLGAALSSDASQPFTVGSFNVTVAALAQGATIMLTAASTVTDSGFNDIFVGPLTIAQVAPEPASAALLGLGLAGLALLGRKRAA